MFRENVVCGDTLRCCRDVLLVRPALGLSERAHKVVVGRRGSRVSGVL
jgi:hypothetical protein